jgi:AmmeMemoRadiSam system protein B
MKPVREPAVAGRFYPKDARTLQETVRSLIASARGGPRPARPNVARVAPHAGYVFSGAVAAAAYALLEGSGVTRVVIVAPSHRIPLRGSSVYDRGAYRTPLGLVPVDEDLAGRLLARGRGEVVVEPALHRSEHSLEVQLPFLQEVLGEFRLTPVIMGLQSEPHVGRLADAIAGAIAELPPGERVLLVASTDLSHYHDDGTARRLDGVVLEDVARFDAAALLEHLESGACEACGGGPLVATLRAARALGGASAVNVAYATSGDVNGDRSEVVGYLAAAVSASPGDGGGPSGVGAPPAAGGSGAPRVSS